MAGVSEEGVVVVALTEELAVMALQSSDALRRPPAPAMTVMSCVGEWSERSSARKRRAWST
jgi:hypothetical protein